MATIKHLGPFELGDVSDDVLGDVVCKQGIPIIVKQTFGGKTACAALAKDKDVKIACAGCFKCNVKMTDNTGCKKCAPFVKHWDKKDGVRRDACRDTGFELETVVANCDHVTLDFANETPTETPTLDIPTAPTLDFVSTAELIAELKKRDVACDAISDMDEDELAELANNRSIWTIFNGRPTHPIHELRQQATNSSIEEHCFKDKEGKCPHCSDKVGADILEPVAHDTRRKKSTKMTKFSPKAVDDYLL